MTTPLKAIEECFQVILIALWCFASYYSLNFLIWKSEEVYWIWKNEKVYWPTFPLWDAPAGNHGSCMRENKYSVQDDECNYYDSLQAHFSIRHTCRESWEVYSWKLLSSLRKQIFNPRWWMQLLWFSAGASHYMTHLQGIMGGVFVKTNIQSKITNATTMITCRHISL